MLSQANLVNNYPELNMNTREDIKRREDETQMQWLERIHDMVLSAGSVARADPEALAIIVEQFGVLLTHSVLLKATVMSASEIAEQACSGHCPNCKKHPTTVGH